MEPAPQGIGMQNEPDRLQRECPQIGERKPFRSVDVVAVDRKRAPFKGVPPSPLIKEATSALRFALKAMSSLTTTSPCYGEGLEKFPPRSSRLRVAGRGDDRSERFIDLRAESLKETEFSGRQSCPEYSSSGSISS